MFKVTVIYHRFWFIWQECYVIVPSWDDACRIADIFESIPTNEVSITRMVD